MWIGYVLITVNTLMVSYLKSIGLGAGLGVGLSLLAGWNDSFESQVSPGRQSYLALIMVGASGGAIVGGLHRVMRRLRERGRSGFYVSWIVSAGTAAAIFGIADYVNGADLQHLLVIMGIGIGIGIGVAMFVEHTGLHEL